MKKKTYFTFKLKDFDLNDPLSKKEYNEKLFSVVALRYDIITGVLSFWRDKIWKKRLLALLPDIDKPRILDVACGTGDITDALAVRYPDGNVTGLDLNEVMLDIARKKITKSNVNFVKGDMCNTGFANSSFDIITGGYAIRNAPDIPQALLELFRITKKGSTIVYLDFSKSNFRPIAFFQILLLRIWGNIWGWIYHRNHEVYGYIADSLKQFPKRELFKRMILETGFDYVSTKLFFFGLISLTIIKK